MSKMLLNSFTFMRGLSEFCATALFIIISCMGCAVHNRDASGNIIASLMYGLSIVVVMHIFGFISGAHANPCVSIACCFLHYIDANMLCLYMACQLAGAAFGYFMLMQMLSQSLIDSCQSGVCIVEPMKDLSNLQILSIEAFLTSVLILAWSALWDVRSGRFLDSVTLRMGCIVTVCHLAGGQLTGSAMNPVKILIPTVFNGNPETVLLQLGGQLLASIIVPQIWVFAYTPSYRPLRVEAAECRIPELYLSQ